MRLLDFKIKNFKSFKNETKFEFKNKISFLLGINGSGKSNFLDAIKYFYSNEKIEHKKFAYIGDEENQSSILLSLHLQIDDDIKKIMHEKIINLFFSDINVIENRINSYFSSIALNQDVGSLIDLLKNYVKSFLENIDDVSFVKEIKKNNENILYVQFQQKDSSSFLTNLKKNIILFYEKKIKRKFSINSEILDMKNIFPNNAQFSSVINNFNDFLSSQKNWIIDEFLKIHLDFRSMIEIHY